MRELGVLLCVIGMIALAAPARADDAAKLESETQHYRLVLRSAHFSGPTGILSAVSTPLRFPAGCRG